MCLLAPSPGRCTFVVCFLDGGRLRLFEDMCLRIHVPDVEKALIIVCDTRFYCDCTTLLPEADRFRQCLCMYLEQMGSAGVSRDAGLGRGCFVRCRSGVRTFRPHICLGTRASRPYTHLGTQALRPRGHRDVCTRHRSSLSHVRADGVYPRLMRAGSLAPESHPRSERVGIETGDSAHVTPGRSQNPLLSHYYLTRTAQLAARIAHARRCWFVINV